MRLKIWFDKWAAVIGRTYITLLIAAVVYTVLDNEGILPWQ